MISETDIQKMVDIIVDKFRPEKIILFGSHACGDPTENSDVDLLVVTESDLPRYRRAAPLYRVLAHVTVPLDILVYTPEEVHDWSAVREACVSRAVREGELLYEKSA